MATGRLPFTGNSMSETLDRVLHANPEAIARFNYEVPAELERIIRKCLEKDRERRYQSGRELEIDLKNLKRDSDAAPVAGHDLGSPTSGASKDSRLLVSGSHWLSARSVVLAVLLALIIGSAVWFSYYQFTNTPSKLSPMRVVRLISFPGSETEPALSPDGKMVAFVSVSNMEDSLRFCVDGLGFEMTQNMDRRGHGPSLVQARARASCDAAVASRAAAA
jgi:eukaryotic-like serine/threonine-protein kinase